MPSGFELCYITDRRSLAAEPGSAAEQALPWPVQAGALLGRVAAAARAGVDWVQIREKDLPTRALAELVRGALRAAEGSATRIIVNDRLDVALALGAHGVHLARTSLTAEAARRLAPSPFLVGVSCHSLEDALEAEAARADYVLLGPVFSTPSKLRYGPPLGLETLRQVAARVRIPVVALGGINLERVKACRQAGAAGIAAIRMFQECASVEDLVAELRRATAN
jgi:thiamine-phosphate pyrophosphorylase